MYFWRISSKLKVFILLDELQIFTQILTHSVEQAFRCNRTNQSFWYPPWSVQSRTPLYYQWFYSWWHSSGWRCCPFVVGIWCRSAPQISCTWLRWLSPWSHLEVEGRWAWPMVCLGSPTDCRQLRLPSWICSVPWVSIGSSTGDILPRIGTTRKFEDYITKDCEKRW